MEDIGECYELEGAKHDGYIRLRLGGRPRYAGAHRLAWMAVNGPIPIGALVLHRCDNRACIRASHLYIGSIADNVRDRVMRHRGYRKVTDAEVEEIRRLYSRRGRDGLSGKELALRYGISANHVSSIVCGHRR